MIFTHRTHISEERILNLLRQQAFGGSLTEGGEGLLLQEPLWA